MVYIQPAEEAKHQELQHIISTHILGAKTQSYGNQELALGLRRGKEQILVASQESLPQGGFEMNHEG